ncbi:MAG: hypothetical protein KAJ29_06695 [Alphaproteobacteria bacterium]|nr:hypothetical protein [Alphaproteobacteria bacterium]
MNKNLFKNMARAGAAKEKSPHPTHKVGAYLSFPEKNISPVSQNNQLCFNYWPAPLADTIGKNKKLGNASATIHAEVAALIKTPISTNQAEIYVTDLPCPNCAKTMAEAGIATVYIDTRTYETPLGEKMRPFFEQVSLLIFKCAGIGVHEIDISGQNISTLLDSMPRDNDLVFAESSCQSIPDFSQTLFREYIKELDNKAPAIPFIACIASDKEGNAHLLTARAHNTVALTQDDIRRISNVQNKYEPMLQPFNRLLAQCAYYNLRINDKHLYISQTPTAREFVNMIGYGFTSITIGNPDKCRDKWGLTALKQIRNHNIMEIT